MGGRARGCGTLSSARAETCCMWIINISIDRQREALSVLFTRDAWALLLAVVTCR